MNWPVRLANSRRRRPGVGASPERSNEPSRPSASVRFAHNSERQFALLLDFYGINWDYEPREFVLEWDRLGAPVLAFRPDFYLPGYDLYIEITTLNQKLVTKKNRKIRQLRALYPGTKIKILYQRDYLNLLVKYGLEEPSQLAEAGLDEIEPQPLNFDVTDDE
jgi:hypoxanthine phosphoribosyltransferase